MSGENRHLLVTPALRGSEEGAYGKCTPEVI